MKPGIVPGIVIASATALLLVTGASARADAAAGAAAFEARQCTACHYTEGPAREVTIGDQLAKTGPELWYAGSKFQRPWLEAWLQDPQPIRSLKYNSLTEDNPGDHPALAAAEAASVADFLMSLVSDVVEAGVEQIFKFYCAQCHGLGGKGDGKGPYAQALNPTPLNFQDIGTIAQLQESFLFWRISTGGPGLPDEGAPWLSSMPVWSEFLTEDEIWKVILFLYDYTGHRPRAWEQG